MLYSKSGVKEPINFSWDNREAAVYTEPREIRTRLMEEQKVCRKKRTIKEHEWVVSKLLKSSSMFVMPGSEYINKTTVIRRSANSMRLKWQKPPKVMHLKLLHHIYLKSQPFLFIFKQCDTQREQIHKYVPSVNKTRLLKVWKTK